MAELPENTTLHDAYLVKLALPHGAGEDGRLYSVLRQADGAPLLCQDVGPSPSGPEAGAVRRELQKGIDLASSLRHAGLATVVDHFAASGREYVVLDANRLQSFETAVQNLDNDPAPNARMKEWGGELCEAFGYLDGQSPCLILNSVDPADIVVDAAGHLKLVNYGLGRCLVPNKPQQLFVESEQDRALNYTALGRLIAFMVTKRTTRVDYNAIRSINPKMAAVVQRCDSFLQSPGLSFHEIKRSLQMAMPEDQRASRPAKANQWNQVWRILRETHPVTYLGIASALAVVWGITHVVRSGPISFKAPGGIASPVVYLGRGSETLEILNAETGRRLFRFPFVGMRMTDIKLLANGQKLVVCDNAAGLLRSFNTDSNTENEPLHLSPPPEVILGQAGARVAYAIQPGTITELSVTPTLKIRRTFRTPHTDGPKTISSHRDYMFVADTHYGSIAVIDLVKTSALNGTINPPTEPGAMAVSPDDKELWVCSPSSGVVQVMSLDNLFTRHDPTQCKVLETVGPLDGSHPASIQFSADGSKVYVLCDESDSVTVINRADHKIAGTIKIGGDHANAWSLGPNDTVWVTNDSSSKIDILNMGALRVDHSLSVGSNPSFLQVYQGIKAQADSTQ